MNNFLKNNFVYLLAFATIIFAVIVIFQGLKAPPSNTPPEVKRFEASPQPTAAKPEATLISTNVRGQLFQVIDPLIINFSQPINIDSLEVGVKPPQAIKKIQLSPTSIALEPDEVWEFDTIYDVGIEFFEKSYKFSFQTEQHKGI